MKHRLLVQEFLDEIRERAESNFKNRLHHAFVDWYVEAEFGGVQWTFTDDAKDGGIDALVWRPADVPPVVVVQSKFAEGVGASRLSRQAYRDFRRVVEAFYEGDDAFSGAFLHAVRDDLRHFYRKAFDQLRGLNDWRHAKKAFRLITTKNRFPGGEFERVPRENFVYADDILQLYAQYRKGATPKARPLMLSIKDKLSYTDRRRGVTSYLFNARLSDFRKYLDRNDVGRLVARNIRYNLGGKVGREIRRTYEREPFNFWYVHNGLTVICDDFTEKNQEATLINPSVVNGAQTLYAITSSSRKESAALVTTRVIVRGHDHDEPIEDDEWVQEVIRGVNTQNRVHAYDFRSNEPEQIELQSQFRDFKVFYERKRGEWREMRNEPRFRNFDRVSLPTMGQILTVVSDKDGQGVLLAKRGIEPIFDPEHYRQLFRPRARIAQRFERMYLAYRLYRLLDRFGYRDARERRRQRHARWNTLWLLHKGMTSVDRLHSRTDVQCIRDTFDDFERNTRTGQRAKKVVKKTRRAVWSAWRKARTSDRERWTANNFFKAKFGNRKVLALAYPQVRSDLQGLAKLLVR